MNPFATTTTHFFVVTKVTNLQQCQLARYVDGNQCCDVIYLSLPCESCWKCFHVDFHEKLTENRRVVRFPFLTTLFNLSSSLLCLFVVLFPFFLYPLIRNLINVVDSFGIWFLVFIESSQKGWQGQGGQVYH